MEKAERYFDYIMSMTPITTCPNLPFVDIYLRYSEGSDNTLNGYLYFLRSEIKDYFKHRQKVSFEEYLENKNY